MRTEARTETFFWEKANPEIAFRHSVSGIAAMQR